MLPVQTLAKAQSQVPVFPQEPLIPESILGAFTGASNHHPNPGAPRDRLCSGWLCLQPRPEELSEGPMGGHTFCMPSWHGPTYRGGGVSVLVSDTLSWLGRSSSRMTWGFSFP